MPAICNTTCFHRLRCAVEYVSQVFASANGATVQAGISFLLHTFTRGVMYRNYQICAT